MVLPDVARYCLFYASMFFIGVFGFWLVLYFAHRSSEEFNVDSNNILASVFVGVTSCLAAFLCSTKFKTDADGPFSRIDKSRVSRLEAKIKTLNAQVSRLVRQNTALVRQVRALLAENAELGVKVLRLEDTIRETRDRYGGASFQ